MNYKKEKKTVETQFLGKGKIGFHWGRSIKPISTLPNSILTQTKAFNHSGKAGQSSVVRLGRNSKPTCTLKQEAEVFCLWEREGTVRKLPPEALAHRTSYD